MVSAQSRRAPWFSVCTHAFLKNHEIRYDFHQNVCVPMSSEDCCPGFSIALFACRAQAARGLSIAHLANGQQVECLLRMQRLLKGARLNRESNERTEIHAHAFVRVVVRFGQRGLIKDRIKRALQSCNEAQLSQIEELIQGLKGDWHDLCPLPLGRGRRCPSFLAQSLF